jgi:predicted transcriptional regulator
LGWRNRNIYIVLIVSYIMEKTTIQVNTQTLERLKSLRVMERQSYDDVLNNLMDNSEEDEVLTQEEIDSINRGLEDIKMGRTVPFEQVLKERGIKLK